MCPIVICVGTVCCLGFLCGWPHWVNFTNSIILILYRIARTILYNILFEVDIATWLLNYKCNLSTFLHDWIELHCENSFLILVFSALSLNCGWGQTSLPFLPCKSSCLCRHARLFLVLILRQIYLNVLFFGPFSFCCNRYAFGEKQKIITITAVGEIYIP